MSNDPRSSVTHKKLCWPGKRKPRVPDASTPTAPKTGPKRTNPSDQPSPLPPPADESATLQFAKAALTTSKTALHMVPIPGLDEIPSLLLAFVAMYEVMVYVIPHSAPHSFALRRKWKLTKNSFEISVIDSYR